MPLVNEYDLEANHYEIQLRDSNVTAYTPAIANPGDVLQMAGTPPEIPEGYSVRAVTHNRITIVNDRNVSMTSW